MAKVIFGYNLQWLHVWTAQSTDINQTARFCILWVHSVEQFVIRST